MEYKARKKGLAGVVLGNLRNRRRQNAILMLGVMVAIFFLSTAVFATSTMMASTQEHMARTFGRHSFLVFDVQEQNLSSLIEERVAREYVVEEALYTSIGNPDKADDDFNIARYTPQLDAMRRFVVSDGRLPQQEGEIAVELAALMRLGQGAELGSQLTLTLESYDGAEETLPQTREKTFTLVGILLSKECYDVGYSAERPLWRLAEALVCEQEQVLPGAREMRTALGIATASGYYKIYNSLDQWRTAHADQWSSPRRTHVEFKNGSDLLGLLTMSDFEAGTMFLCVVIGFLALTGAAMAGIANALTANIEKRARQIGLLRAVGATQRQIRRLLLTETLTIALVTLPLGVGLAAGLVYLFGRMYPNVIVYSVPVWMIALDALVCGACVFIASFMPLRKTVHITPMQAVRDIEKNRLFLKKGWKSRKSFAPARLLAKRNNALRKGRTFGMQLLVCTGTVLFCILLLLCTTELYKVRRRVVDWEYEMYNFGSYRSGFVNSKTHMEYGGVMTAQDWRDLQAVPYVERVDCRQEIHAVVLVDEMTDYLVLRNEIEYISPEISMWERHRMEEGLYNFTGGMDTETYLREEAQKEYDAYLLLKQKMGWEEDVEALQMMLYAQSDGYLESAGKNVAQGKIDRAKLDSGEEIIVCVPSRYAFIEWPDSMAFGDEIRPEHGTVYENDAFFAGDEIDLCVSYVDEDGIMLSFGEVEVDESLRQVRKTLKIGAVLEGGNEFCLITSMQGAAALGIEGAYNRFHIYTADFPDDETRELVSKEIEGVAMRNTGTYFYDNVAIVEQSERVLRIYVIASVLGLCVMFLFSFAMLSSTVAGKVQSDVHQIGTMRAVGGSKRAVFRCYAWQLYRMFLWGGAIGWAVSVPLVYLDTMYQSAFVKDGGWLCYLSAPVYALVLLAACLISVRAKLRPVFKSSVVENIRVL